MPGRKPRYTNGRVDWPPRRVGVSRTTITDQRDVHMGANIPNANEPGGHRARHLMRIRSDFADVLRLQSLRTLSHVELDVVALGEAAEALCLDRCEVHEHVWTRLLRDKAKALRVVKPLHLTLCHTIQTSAHGGTAPDWIDPGHRGRGRAQTKTARHMVLAEAQTAGDGATYA